MSDRAYPDLASVEDWLNSRGYTGEAGACHAAMDKIREQARRIAELETDATYYEANDEVMMRDIEYYRARIAELEAEVSDLNECLTLAHMDGFEKGRDAARAALEKKNG